jgi:hypothetical protein
MPEAAVKTCFYIHRYTPMGSDICATVYNTIEQLCNCEVKCGGSKALS